MKKIVIALSIVALAIITIVACKKNESVPDINKEFTVESVKAWFNSSFKTTSAYKQNNKNENEFKLPNWSTGIIYKMGNVQIAEFVLQTNKKSIRVIGNNTEAEQKRMAEATKHKILFIKAPNKEVEIRIIQLMPEYTYLQNNAEAFSKLNFSNYKTNFIGTFMMYDYSGNFMKGYLHGCNGVRPLKLAPKRNTTTGTNTATETAHDVTNPWMLDNLDPDCNYLVHFYYEIVCTGGWNPDEGFNPNYCTVSITIENVETVSCNGGDLQNCLNNGNTPDQCNCLLYNICDEDNGGDETCTQKDSEIEAYANSLQTGFWGFTGNTESTNGLEVTKKVNWKFARYFNGLGIESGWKSYERMTIKKDNANAPWEFVAGKHYHDKYDSYGYFLGYSESCGENHPVEFIDGFSNSLKVKLDVTLKVEVTCYGHPITKGRSVTPEGVFSASGVGELP